MNINCKYDTEPIMVSIQCITYNQEKYIRDALEGFVMQKTNFKFEAIVHDDASTDGTAAIIREYAEKYPDIIKPIYETENQYSKHDGTLYRIMNEACKGKYVAFCEGDDYWTDSYKLQKQVDFLETNPEYSMVFHNAKVFYEETKTFDESFSNVENRDYSGLEIFKKWTVPTASVLIRRDVIESDLYNTAISDRIFIYGDILIFLSAAHYGKLRGISDVMSVYRRHIGGVSYNQSYKTNIRQCYHSLEIYKIFGPIYKKCSINIFIEKGFYNFLNSRAHNEINYKLLFDLIRISPFKTLSLFFKRFIK